MHVLHDDRRIYSTLILVRRQESNSDQVTLELHMLVSFLMWKSHYLCQTCASLRRKTTTIPPTSSTASIRPPTIQPTEKLVVLEFGVNIETGAAAVVVTLSES